MTAQYMVIMNNKRVGLITLLVAAAVFYAGISKMRI